MVQPIVELIDRKMVKIIELFSNNPSKEFYLREISRKTLISPATAYRILKRLVKKGIIEQRAISRFKLYKLKDNEKARQIAEVFSKKRDAIETFKELILKSTLITKIEKIYLLDSKSSQDKASFLIIGNSVSSLDFKEIIKKIKEEFNFNINILSLTPEQYENMISMGLFSGKKPLLYP